MLRSEWVLCLLVSAGCASAPRAAPASPVVSSSATSPPPPVASPTTRQLTGDAWREMRERGDFTVVELERVGEARERSMGSGDDAAAPPGTVRLTQCRPGGGDEFVARERATGALWRAVAVGGVHAPPGVQISATRCFEGDYRLPAGEVITGRIVVSYR